MKRKSGSLPLITRVLVANGLVVLIGAAFGTVITKMLVERSAFGLALIFSAAGVAISLLVNYLVLEIALRPLSSLTDAVDKVQNGHTAVRAPMHPNQVPDLARLTRALNTMLDRLAAHTATIEVHREQLRALSSKVSTVQEEERKRISRELHDETSQSMATLLIALERVDAAIPDDLSDLKSRLAAARRLTITTLEGLRALIADLRPLLLDDLGLIPAIRWYASDRLESQGIDVEVSTSGTMPRLPPAVETAVFRIAQEAISNVVKHAEASQVRIELVCQRDLTLRIEDDGVGFRVDEASDYNGLHHLGLFGIRERALALGGDCTIRSFPGEGTQVRVRIPLETTGGTHELKDPGLPGG